MTLPTITPGAAEALSAAAMGEASARVRTGIRARNSAFEEQRARREVRVMGTGF
jgi:hypothetical protein